MKLCQVNILILIPVLISAQLDLKSIKKQQTYPSGTATTVSTPGTVTTVSTPGTAPTVLTTGTVTPVSTATTTSVGPCNVGCQNGWIPYGGNCYKKMIDVLTQSTAEQECIELGAHLVSFETTEEATAIKNLVLTAPLFTTDLLSFTSSSQESWIGLSKTINGAWKWTDSSEVEFTNLPDGTTVTGESCVSMNISGVWKPNDCSATSSSFICKKVAST